MEHLLEDDGDGHGARRGRHEREQVSSGPSATVSYPSHQPNTNCALTSIIIIPLRQQQVVNLCSCERDKSDLNDPMRYDLGIRSCLTLLTPSYQIFPSLPLLLNISISRKVHASLTAGD